MQHFIDVILPIPLEKLFTYTVSSSQSAHLEPGMRVAVPFGKSKIYTALVAKIHTTPPEVYESKEIHQLLDEGPIVNDIQLRHWKWIAGYYMCTIGEVFRSALPGAFLLESETLILKNGQAEVDEDTLKDDEFLIYEALCHQAILKVQEVSAIIDRKNVLPVLNRLLNKNIILLQEEIHETYRPKMVRYVQMGKGFANEAQLESLLQSLSRAPKQSQVVLSLFQLKGSSRNRLNYRRWKNSAGFPQR
jgi:primosomal protein N' (replication factor Y)